MNFCLELLGRPNKLSIHIHHNFLGQVFDLTCFNQQTDRGVLLSFHPGYPEDPLADVWLPSDEVGCYNSSLHLSFCSDGLCFHWLFFSDCRGLFFSQKLNSLYGICQPVAPLLIIHQALLLLFQVRISIGDDIIWF